MRLSVLLPAAIIFCACTKSSDGTGVRKVDSAVATDSASTGRVSASTTGSKTGVQQAAQTPPKTAPQGTPASPPPASSKSKSSATRPVDTRCGIRGNPVLTDLGIGNLSVGRTATIVKSTCRVIRDIEELTSEGTLDRVLTVVAGDDVYRATVVNDLVWRISVRTPRVATRDGLRVGTPLSRVATEKGVKIAEGEDGLYLLPESHCGLSFRFSVQSRLTTGRQWTLEELVRRHGRVPVARILVTRCVRPR